MFELSFTAFSFAKWSHSAYTVSKFFTVRMYFSVCNIKQNQYIIGLPVRATPNQEMKVNSFCQKETKWRTELPGGFACPIPPSMGPIFAVRGRVTSGRLANRFGNRFGTNTKSLRVVIGPISMPNDHHHVLELHKQSPPTFPTKTVLKKVFKTPKLILSHFIFRQ